MLSQFFNPVVGGEERMVEVLGRELVARGHDVCVATLEQEGAAEHEVIEGIRVHRVGSLTGRARWLYTEAVRRHVPPAPDPLVVSGLRGIVAAERPDVVHAHNWLVYSFLPFRKACNAPLILSLHDYGLVCVTKRLMNEKRPCTGPAPVKCARCAAQHYSPVKGVSTVLLHRASASFLARAVDLYLPVSNAVAERSGLRRAGLRYEVIPNFVVPRDEDLALSPDSALLEQLPTEPFALFVGDVSTDKGVHVLLEAHAALSGDVPLVVIGRRVTPGLDDSRGPKCFLGPASHRVVFEAMRRSAMVVVPSIWPDPFPLVALEAAAAGRPVIAARSGGLVEMVVDGETGLLVSAGDARALAGAMQRLFGDPELRAMMGQAGARRIERLFSPSRIVPRFEQAYRSQSTEAAGR